MYCHMTPLLVDLLHYVQCTYISTNSRIHIGHHFPSMNRLFLSCVFLFRQCFHSLVVPSHYFSLVIGLTEWKKTMCS